MFRNLVTIAIVLVAATVTVPTGAKAQAFDPRSWSVDTDSGTVRPPSAEAYAPEPPAETRRYFVEPARVVAYQGAAAPGSLVISTAQRTLLYILGEGRAIQYSVGVGRDGFAWSGADHISAKREWPDWHPPAEMRLREAERGRILPARVDGGPNNPLGARALYIGNTLYRVHGTNEPWTVGAANSSGCIRMTNADVIDLYRRVEIGATVTVSH